MPFFEGEVTVFIKEIQNPNDNDKKWNYTHNCSLVVDFDKGKGNSVWYSYGNLKGPALIVDKQEVGSGSKVEFMWEANGDWKNIKKETLSIVELKAPDNSWKGKSTSAGSKGKKDDVGVVVGAVVNLLGPLLEKDPDLDKEAVTLAYSSTVDDLKAYLVKEYSMDDYSAGQTAGNVVKNVMTYFSEEVADDYSNLYDECVDFHTNMTMKIEEIVRESKESEPKKEEKKEEPKTDSTKKRRKF